MQDVLGFSIGFIRLKENYVVERWQGKQPFAGAKRVAIFAHFDRTKRVQDYVLYYLDQLVRAGFAVVFVTNSPAIEPASLLNVQSKCAVLLRRRNVGHDFGAYKDGLALIGDLAEYEEVLLANDSVYGPFCDLSVLLERCDDSAAVWGITDSWERRFHLQSYFLLLKKPALVDRRLREFWGRVRYLSSRRFIIRYYEIGFTRAILRADLRCAALFPYRRAAEAISAAALSGQLSREDLSPERRSYLQRLFDAIEHGTPLNATHFFWDYLIGELGCPFLKRDLLTRNPMEVPFVSQWQMLLRRSSGYDTDMIVHDLEQTLRDRSI
jgi:lipopolysaccharide biosynthesis protein